MQQVSSSTSEPMFWPADLFRETVDANVRWWAIHTRPRTEKALARCLLRHEIAYFLPLYERRRRMQRRLVRTFPPLFPSYLFFRGDEDARRKALETNFIVGCLRIEDQNDLTADLARIHDVIQSGAPMSPEGRLQPGMLAKITAGPLAGMEGRIIRGQTSMKFVVAVDFLQQGASIEVDVSMIQPA